MRTRTTSSDPPAPGIEHLPGHNPHRGLLWSASVGVLF
nr:MAG TPA: hypothetical protein [Caudoviricetes sp.]